jgi:hypothetical protein
MSGIWGERRGGSRGVLLGSGQGRVEFALVDWDRRRELVVYSAVSALEYRRYQRTHKAITSHWNWRPLKGLCGLIDMEFYPT